MRIILITLAVMVTPASQTYAKSAEPRKPCFDFNAKIQATLIPAPSPSEYKEGDDPYDFGRIDRVNSGTKIEFGKVAGIVKHPIQKVYATLLDPRTVRPDEETKITLTESKSPHFLKRVEQSIHIQPVFFITLEWTESWAYSLLKGTVAQPESILASYEKTSGTSYIRHLCGNILLEKVKPDHTAVFLFEEIDADRREAKDVLNGLRGTLSTLRDQKTAKK